MSTVHDLQDNNYYNSIMHTYFYVRFNSLNIRGLLLLFSCN